MGDVSPMGSTAGRAAGGTGPATARRAARLAAAMAAVFVTASSHLSCRAHSTPLAERPTCTVSAAIPYWDTARAVDSFKAHADVIRSVSVFWYTLDAEGRVRAYQRANEDPELIRFARERGVDVLATVTNLPDDEVEGSETSWDAARVALVIEDEERRAAHIAELVALTERMKFDGVLVDYESLPGALRQAFSRFVAELAAALHAQGKILHVAVHPKTAENDPREDNGSAAQDWDALQQHADELHLMTYSQHTESTPPGPVASPRWVAPVLRYAVNERKVPAAKLRLGLPLYAEAWERVGPDEYRGLARDLTFEDVQERAREHGGEVSWSEEHDSPFLEYQDDEEREHVIWFEDERSAAVKLALAREHGVCNLALWRLGGEDPGVWDRLRESGWRGRTPPAPDDASAQAPQGDGDEDGGDYPRLTWEASFLYEVQSRFAAPDPSGEYLGAPMWADSKNTLELTRGLVATAELRFVVRAKDHGRHRFHSDYPYEGLYVRRLWLQYDADRFSVFGGRYEAMSGLRGRAPIFFGNYTTQLDLSGRFGVGATVRVTTDALGKHELTGHATYVDTSRLGGELLSGRSRRSYDYDGAVGAPLSPDGYLVTLSGGNPDPWSGIHYTLGGGVQEDDDVVPLPRRVYLGALYGTTPLGPGGLTLSATGLRLRGYGYARQDFDTLLLGMSYGRWPRGIGVAYAVRLSDRPSGDAAGGRRADHVAEVLARWGWGEHLRTEAAYQYVNENGNVFMTVGLALVVDFEWASDG